MRIKFANEEAELEHGLWKDALDKAKKTLESAKDKAKNSAKTSTKTASSNLKKNNKGNTSGWTWDKHKYLRIENGRYIYEEAKNKVTSAVNNAKEKVQSKAENTRIGIKNATDNVSSLVKNAKDSVDSKINNVKSGIDNAKNNVKDIADRVRDRIENPKYDLGEKARETVKNVKTKANDLIKSLKGANVKEKISDFKDLIKYDDEIKPAVKNTINNALNKANDFASTASDRIEDMLDKALKSASDAGKKVSDIVNNAKDKASDAINNAKDRASDAVNNAKDRVSNAVNNAKDKASNAIDRARDSVTDTIDNAKSRASDAANDVKNKAQSGMQDLKKAAENAYNKIYNDIEKVINEKIPELYINPNLSKLGEEHSSAESAGLAATYKLFGVDYIINNLNTDVTDEFSAKELASILAEGNENKLAGLIREARETDDAFGVLRNIELGQDCLATLDLYKNVVGNKYNELRDFIVDTMKDIDDEPVTTEYLLICKQAAFSTLLDNAVASSLIENGVKNGKDLELLLMRAGLDERYADISRNREGGNTIELKKNRIKGMREKANR